jgi:hypothetical protein
MTIKKMPQAVEDEIPANDIAAAEYFDVHDISSLMEDADWFDPIEPVGVQEMLSELVSSRSQSGSGASATPDSRVRAGR